MKNNTQCFISAIALAGAMILTSVATAKDLGIPPFNPGDFGTPQDNIYMPMAVGLTYVYTAEEEDGTIRDVVSYTTDTKVILGVTCVVVEDVEHIYVEELASWFITEATDDWYAWDNYGNVWYFGEDTTAYEYDDDWNLLGTTNEGAWEAGVGGALPGIVMLANPMVGLSYYQEYYADEAEDQGKVMRLDVPVEIDYGEFENCLKTKEWTKLAPGEVEHKYYAPDVGLVYIEELKNKTVKVELIDIY